MRFRTGESEPTPSKFEPTPLGVETDPASAELWEEFYTTPRSLDDIYELWKDPQVTNPTIRQRMTTILTAPHGYQLSYAHPDQGLNRMLSIEENLDGLRSKRLHDRLEGRSELAHELAAGALYWMDEHGGTIPGDILDSRQNYQNLILELLPVVEEPVADDLFERFSLNDLEAFEGWDSSSGYNPLRRLLFNRAVPQKYKEIGLGTLLKLVEAEESGEAHPRAEHERAVRVAAYTLESMSYYGSYYEDLATKVTTILEENVPQLESYVSNFSVAQIAEIITSPLIKYRFASRHIFADREATSNQFTISNNAELKLANWVKDYANQRELYIYDKIIDNLVTSYEFKRTQQEKANAAEQDIQARMRA